MCVAADCGPRYSRYRRRTATSAGVACRTTWFQWTSRAFRVSRRPSSRSPPTTDTSRKSSTCTSFSQARTLWTYSLMIIHRSRITIRNYLISLLVLLFLWRLLKNRTPLFRIGSGKKFGRNVLQVKKHRLTDFNLTSHFQDGAMMSFYARKCCHLMSELTRSAYAAVSTVPDLKYIRACFWMRKYVCLREQIDCVRSKLTSIKSLTKVFWIHIAKWVFG